MGKLVRLPNRRQIREEACAWLARIDAGLTDRDREALDRWLAASPRHPEALLEMARLWDDLDVLNELSALFPLRPSGTGHTARRRVWQIVLPLASMAGLAAIVVALAFVLRPSPAPLSSPAATIEPTSAVAEAHETAVGEQSSVRLKDGSLLLLNTDTRVSVRFSESERRVYLERGEASFNVAPDPARPFAVHAGNRIVEAIGTVFNVQLGPDDDVEVTVTEGRVRVMLAPSTKRPARPAFLGPLEPEATVGPGEILRLDPQLRGAKGEVHRLDPEDIEIQLSWQHGVLVFKGEPLSTALREVARYTTVGFELADPALGDIRVGGYFRVGDVDGLLVALRENFQIEARRSGDRILLTAE